IFTTAFVLACHASVIESVLVQGTRLPVNLATQVGREYDARTVARDVQQLWETGRFDDIRVEVTGTNVVFRVLESQHLRLRKIVIEPSGFGLQPKVPEGSRVTRLRAHEIALEAQRQLEGRGYPAARVDYALEPAGGNQ